VVLGHRQCGGILSLFQPENVRNDGFVQQWMKISSEAKQKVLDRLPHGDTDSLCRECERESIVASIQNLHTFPFIEEAIKARGMSIYGLYFDLELGQLWNMDEATMTFHELTWTEK
jgi:carbonic anhydrase